jgi:hypothetical protein
VPNCGSASSVGEVKLENVNMVFLWLSFSSLALMPRDTHSMSCFVAVIVCTILLGLFASLVVCIAVS